MAPIPRTLVVAGVALVVVGLVWQVGGRLGLGRLPGDIVWVRGSVRMYIPIATSLVVSVVLSVALLIVRLLSR